MFRVDQHTRTICSEPQTKADFEVRSECQDTVLNPEKATSLQSVHDASTR